MTGLPGYLLLRCFRSCRRSRVLGLRTQIYWKYKLLVHTRNRKKKRNWWKKRIPEATRLLETQQEASINLGASGVAIKLEKSEFSEENEKNPSFARFNKLADWNFVCSEKTLLGTSVDRLPSRFYFFEKKRNRKVEEKGAKKDLQSLFFLLFPFRSRQCDINETPDG